MSARLHPRPLDAAAPVRPRTASPATEAAALLHLGRWLRAAGYSFTTVTPETHRRVNARADGAPARCLRDVFGWSRPFRRTLLSEALWTLLERAGALAPDGTLFRSTVRFSTLNDLLFVHSAYPTVAADSVFFGPDTYRFAAFVRAGLAAASPGRVRSLVDIGCGSGAGGIVAAQILQPERLVLTDINPKALRFATASAGLAHVSKPICVLSDVLQAVDGPLDLVVANPPYLLDREARLYRHGGGDFGGELSVRIVRESLERLAPGGRLLLYSGTPVVNGEDQLLRALQPLLDASPARYRYAELDPDVFGEELDNPAYAQAERIAAVGLTLELP